MLKFIIPAFAVLVTSTALADPPGGEHNVRRHSIPAEKPIEDSPRQLVVDGNTGLKIEKNPQTGKLTYRFKAKILDAQGLPAGRQKVKLGVHAVYQEDHAVFNNEIERTTDALGYVDVELEIDPAQEPNHFHSRKIDPDTYTPQVPLPQYWSLYLTGPAVKKSAESAFYAVEYPKDQNYLQFTVNPAKAVHNVDAVRR